MIRNLALKLLRASGLMPLAARLSNFRYALVKKYCAWRGRDPIRAIYSRKYFNIETGLTQPTADAVVDEFIREFAPSEVLDVGCGTAVYLAEFQRRGVEIHGVEGSENAIAESLVDSRFIRQVDLRRPLVLDRRFSLVLCLEVAEHLPETAASALTRSLANAGDRIIFSAAQPGQGGVDHINEQPAEYWISQFAACGHVWDDQRTHRLRSRLTERECVWWLCHNLLVFVKGDKDIPSASPA